MLILFDIDMTLISTSGCGMKAMTDAGRELFGPTFTTEGIQFAGRLDTLIIPEMFKLNGAELTPKLQRSFRTTYARHLEGRLAQPGIGRALPGVMDLLGTLEKRKAITLGLLTGNFEETGSMKLRACGIDPGRFSVRVWGDESPHDPPRREHLVPIGIGRARAQRVEELSHENVVVIGDTPHDVQCAKAHGCRSLGVATGHFPPQALEAAGADLALQDLSQTAQVVSWLLGPTTDERERG